MDTKKGQLTIKDILHQEFKTTMRGYSQEEVDKFLDVIIKDYEAFQNQIVSLQQENAKYKKLLDDQKSNVTPFTNTNTDILKRLSNLEKHVFGSKLYE
ncbi:cell division regulator GpsB [Bacillus sp. RG28]|uniref:Cell division regulator GpsB n=1 Tax=Gottfriedia endophytica TaxID=2820819 RepID=A0A940NMC0_9BACI|nr:cell division regulator GpsB [Gottfriedia endophytica]MBP0724170.1 cell division regulator GpsB [Gottfriedia endophytica]